MRVKKTVVIDVSPGNTEAIVKRLEAANLPDHAYCTKVDSDIERIYINNKDAWSTVSWCQMTFEWEDDE